MIDDGGEEWFKEIMNATLFALFTAISMVGCGPANLDDSETLDKIIAEAIDEDVIQQRDIDGVKLIYAANKQSPYTGWAITDYDNGQIRDLMQIKDGLVNGQGIKWYKNGQKKIKTNHKDGKLMFAEVWKPNGEKCGTSTVVDGVGVIKIYGDDSTHIATHGYRNGKLVENKINW